MNKNMRTWVIGICVALVIIVAVAAAFANNRSGGSLTPENLASLMAAYFFVKFRKFLVRNSVIYDIIRLYHLS